MADSNAAAEIVKYLIKGIPKTIRIILFGTFTAMMAFTFLVVFANAAECQKVSVFWGVHEYTQRPRSGDAICRQEPVTNENKSELLQQNRNVSWAWLAAGVAALR